MMDAMTNPFKQIIGYMDNFIARGDKMNAIMKGAGGKGLISPDVISNQQQMVANNQQIVHLTQIINNNYNQINTTLNQTNSTLNQTNNSVNNFNQGMKQGKKSADDLGESLKKILATYLSIQGLKGLFGKMTETVMNTADGITSETKLAQVLNTRMGMDTRQIQQFTGELKKMGRTGSVSYDALVEGASEMATYMTDAKALMSTLNTLSNMSAAQYGANTTPEQFYNLATGAGRVYSGQAGGLSRQGWILDDSDVKIFKVGTDTQKAATFADLAADSYGEMNKVIAETPSGKVRQLNELMNEVSTSLGTNLLPSFMYATQEINIMLSEMLDSGKIDEFFTGIGNAIGVGVNLAAQAVGAATNFIVENIDLVQSILISLSVVFAAFAVTWIVGWIAAAWPVLAIIAGIAAIVYALSRFGVTAEQIIGFVTGLFSVLGANIHNMIAFVYNGFADFAEFFANVFNHPVYTVKRLFVNFANTVLDLVKQVANAIDAVFGSNLAGSLTSLNEKMNEWLGEMPEGYKVLERMQTKDLTEAAKNGYQAGASFVSGVGDMIEGFKVGAMPSFALGPGASGELGDIGKVKKVGKIEDKVDISSEDLKTMRELAEMKSIQNFVTLTPTVTVSTGDINTGEDFDSIMARITATLEEEIASSSSRIYE